MPLRWFRPAVLCVVVGFGLLTPMNLKAQGKPPAGAASPASPERRVYGVWINKRQAGEYQMNIAQESNGTVAVTTQADVRTTVLGASVYKYTYRGTEVWSAGRRVLQLASATNDNGKEFALQARADGEQLRVKVNGQERPVQVDWLTTYWRLPDAKLHNRPIHLLDVDNGRSLTVKLMPVGNEQLTISGKHLVCAHYRLVGDVQVDLWYDGQDRLIRQEYTEDRHHVVHELVQIRR